MGKMSSVMKMKKTVYGPVGHAIMILEWISRISRIFLEADVKCNKDEEAGT